MINSNLICAFQQENSAIQITIRVWPHTLDHKISTELGHWSTFPEDYRKFTYFRKIYLYFYCRDRSCWYKQLFLKLLRHSRRPKDPNIFTRTVLPWWRGLASQLFILGPQGVLLENNPFKKYVWRKYGVIFKPICDFIALLVFYSLNKFLTPGYSMLPSIDLTCCFVRHFLLMQVCSSLVSF